jgi:hypothetical protein
VVVDPLATGGDIDLYAFPVRLQGLRGATRMALT